MKEEIGKRKYEALKALDLDNVTDDSIMKLNVQFPNLSVGEALKSVNNFESKNAFVTNETKIKVGEYFDRINQPEKPKEIKPMTKEWLWGRFSENYLKNEGVRYSKNPDSVENIKPLIYYFLGEFEEFKKCKNVSLISEPSMEKGLLVIGGYGNGKTSVMKALRKSLAGTNIPFRNYAINDLVTMYEECKDADAKAEFNRITLSGTVYFDDILTEREASNYGKFNLVKDILEQRYDRKLRTYITCNKKDGSDDINDGLMQFGTKYGSRVYDRLFSMFNVIEFKGKSHRV